MINEIHLGDCLEVMTRIPSGSVDMILCDLPYGTTRNAWDSVIPLEPLWAEYKRVVKSNGAIILTGSQPFSSTMVTSNLNSFKYEWVWVKTKITGVLNARKMPVRKHEQVLVFSYGKPTYNPQGLVPKNTVTKQGGSSSNYNPRPTQDYVQEWENWPRDVLEIPSEGKTTHPTQKPVALFEYLIKTYTNPGEVVLDNCIGSGTTAIAALNTGRRFIGIERDPRYHLLAVERVQQRQMELLPAWLRPLT